MQLQMISRKEAEKRYVAGECVYIGAYTKKDGGAWWELNQFSKDIPLHLHTMDYFTAAARYYGNRYCPHCRTRYAVEVS